MLDMKDRRILVALDRDAQLTFKELGKRAGIAQESARYRYERLVANGTISRCITYLNFTRLGYFGYCVYCRFATNIDREKQRFLAALQDNRRIYWVAEFGGRFDLAFAFLAKTPLEFDTALRALLSKHPGIVTDITLVTKLDPHKYDRTYLLRSATRRSPSTTIDVTGDETLSAQERRIIKLLTQDARIPKAEIARRLCTPLSTIAYIVKGLARRGILGGSTIVAQPPKFGYLAFQLNVRMPEADDSAWRKLISYCESKPNIIFAIRTLGPWNAEILYEIESAHRMQEHIVELRTLLSDTIRDVELLNIFEDYRKLSHYPFED